MQVNLPPILPYAIGALLVLSGLLRVKYLGAPRIPRPKSTQDGIDGIDGIDTPASDIPVRGKEQKRHVRMGIIWVGLGLFLVVSTYLQIRRQG